jgi:branched-chain amino acid transport system permease protein
MMGVLNFAHASFYMLGAYIAYSTSQVIGFWPALLVAPLLVFVMGAAFERYACARCTSSATCPSCCSPSACPTCCWNWCSWWGPLGRQLRADARRLQGPLFTLFGTNSRSRAPS